MCAGPAPLSNTPLCFDVELNAQRHPSLLEECLGRQFYDPQVFYLVTVLFAVRDNKSN